MTETHLSEEKKRTFSNFDLTVGKVDVLTPRVKNIQFRYSPGQSMDFKAGQFVQLFIPAEPTPRRTSYSIASPPHRHEFFELCVTLVEGGQSSGYLHHLKEGDSIKGLGPLGKFILPTEIQRDLVFIATGSGIAPFRSMILDLLEKKIDRTLYLVFGNRFVDDIIYRKDWEDLAQTHANFKPLFTLSKPDATWKGKSGYVQEMIADFVPQPQNKDFFICGLVKMIDAVSEKLVSLGVPKTQIHFERYD